MDGGQRFLVAWRTSSCASTVGAVAMAGIGAAPLSSPSLCASREKAEEEIQERLVAVAWTPHGGETREEVGGRRASVG
jgi:hypothetical protein